MKKIISLTLALTIFLAACGGGTSNQPATQPTAVTAQATATSAPTKPPAPNTLAPTKTSVAPTIAPTQAPTQPALVTGGTTQDFNTDAFEHLDTGVGSVIKDVVMAKDVTDSFEPVDVTTEFPADTTKFFAVVMTQDAPAGTLVKAQWVIVDVGDIAPPDTVITESEIEIEGSVNIGFSLTPDAGKLPGGAYKVNIFVNGNFDGSIGFQVQGAPQVSSSVISRIVPFNETDAQGEPIDNGGKFPGGVTELAVAVYYVNAPSQTLIKGDWTAVDVGGVVPNNSALTTTEKEVEGSSVLTLSIRASKSLPNGTYQVDVSANGTFVQAVTMSIGSAATTQPGQPKQPTGDPNNIEYVGDVKLEPAPESLAGLALDKSGNVYVGVSGGLIQVAPDGSQKKFGELGDSFNAQDNKFIAVNDIAVDDNGNIYTIDTIASSAQKGDARGNFKKWGASELYQPFGIALDAQGNVYIADTFNRRVAKFDANGKLLAEYSNMAGGIAPLGIVISDKGNIIVTDGIKHRIVVLDPNGNFLVEFGKQGTGPGEFNQPAALALLGSNLYVVDAGNQRVQVIDNQGNFVSQFGKFSQPRQIAIALDGTIYVSDFGNKNVQMFRAGGSAKSNTSQPNASGARLGEGNVIVDLGFRPEKDGFGFENYGGEYPRQQGDVYVEDLIRMFGEEQVCAGYHDGACQVSPGMLKYADQINEASNNGHCEGMAVLSMRIFKQKESPQSFQANAQSVYDLKLQGNQNLRREIMYYFALQGTAPTFNRKNESLQSTPSQVLDTIIGSLKAGEPVAIAIRQAGIGGHAIAPYAVEERGSGLYYVWVYDNNWPGEPRYIEVNRNAETWQYSFGALNPSKPPTYFKGDARTHTFAAVPITVREQKAECLFCADATAKSADALTQLTLFGQGDLLITNAEGQRIGFVNGTFVNEIPGADSLLIDTGLGIDSEPIYFVPTSDTYEITLAGSETARTEANLFIFGGGAVMELDNISLAAGEQDVLTMDPGNFDFAYYAADDQSPEIDLAIDGADEDYLFEFDGLSFEGGETIGFDLEGNRLLLDSDNGSADDMYGFSFTRVGDDGTQQFENDSVAFGDDETQYLDFGDWEGDDDEFNFDVDENDDGTVDEEFTEENE